MVSSSPISYASSVADGDFRFSVLTSIDAGVFVGGVEAAGVLPPVRPLVSSPTKGRLLANPVRMLRKSNWRDSFARRQLCFAIGRQMKLVYLRASPMPQKKKLHGCLSYERQ